MNSKDITSTYVVNELQKYQNSILENHDWYQQIFAHTPYNKVCKTLPTLQNVSSLATFFESGLLLYTAKVEIPFVGEDYTHCISALERKVHNKYVANNFSQFCLTEGTGAILCVMVDGKIKLVPPQLTVGNSDIVSVLQFTSTLSDLSNRGLGQFADCTNLVYIPPIPEGITSLENAFKGCTNLNCPIYIPSTVTDVTGMLDGCASFNSSIYGSAFLNCTGHEKYIDFYSGSY